MKLRSQKGAAVVEFAVILPLLLLMVFGIIEFGFLFFNKAMITNASREGARFGILSRPDRTGLNTEISDRVDTYLQNYLVTFGDTDAYTVTTEPADASTITTDDYLTVTVSYPYDFLLVPAFVSNFSDGVTLEGVTTMRVE